MALACKRALLVLVVLVFSFGAVFSADAQLQHGAAISGPKLLNGAFLQVDQNGGGLLGLSNNSKQPVTITGISLSGQSFLFNEDLGKKSGAGFFLPSLNGLCGGKHSSLLKSAQVTVSFSSPSGSASETGRSVLVICVKKLIFPKHEKVVYPTPVPAPILGPLVINSCEGLQGVNNKLDGNYALGGDIDCSATRNWNLGAGFVPLGSYGVPFSGSFDGNGHAISHLYINRPALAGVGLFGVDSPSASVTNLSLSDANVTGYDNVGGMFGELFGHTANDFVTDRIEVWGNPVDSIVGNAVGIYHGNFPGITVTVPDGMYFGNALGDFGMGG